MLPQQTCRRGVQAESESGPGSQGVTPSHGRSLRPGRPGTHWHCQAPPSLMINHDKEAQNNLTGAEKLRYGHGSYDGPSSH